MSDTLRSQIIRLAHTRPDLRSHLLPLVASEDDIPFEVRGPGGLLFVNVRAPEIWVRTVPSDPPYNQEYYSLELDVFGPKRPAKAARKVYDDNKAEIMRLRTFREVREFIDERVLALVGRKPSWRERFSVFD